MKIIIADQFEFDNVGSEEFLVIATAKSNQYKSLKDFYAATKQKGCFNSKAVPVWDNQKRIQEFSNFSMISHYLQKFLGESPSSSAVVFDICNEWDEKEMLIEEKGTFVRFYWETTA